MYFYYNLIFFFVACKYNIFDISNFCENIIIIYLCIFSFCLSRTILYISKTGCICVNIHWESRLNEKLKCTFSPQFEATIWLIISGTLVFLVIIKFKFLFFVRSWLMIIIILSFIQMHISLIAIKLNLLPQSRLGYALDTVDLFLIFQLSNGAYVDCVGCKLL